jgi:hypothetical protein
MCHVQRREMGLHEPKAANLPGAQVSRTPYLLEPRKVWPFLDEADVVLAICVRSERLGSLPIVLAVQSDPVASGPEADCVGR